MAGPVNTILVPTDGSDDAILAAQVATDLAQRTGAVIHLANAWQINTYVGDPYLYAPALSNDYYTINEEVGRTALETEMARITAAGGTVAATHLVQGRAPDEMVALAKEIGADLIVVGSRGLGPVRRLVLGSVSEGIVHHASCPVLVVRGGATAWPPQRVVVGDDGSETAERAVQLAAGFAKLYAAQGVLAQAFLPTVAPYSPADPDLARQEEARQQAEAALGERAATLDAAFGKRPTTRLAIDDAAALLLKIAEEDEQPALVVVGSRGLGPFQRFRLGSTSTKLLHAAQCPVLVVPGRED